MEVKEQLNIFHNMDMIEPLITKMDQIREDESLDEAQKVELITSLMESLSDEDKREYMHFIRTTMPRTATKPVCQNELKGRYLMMEFTNIQYSYCQSLAFFGMISYMMTRLEGFIGDESEKKALHKFFMEVFGGTSDKYIGTIYDLFYKNNKNKYPDHIPEFDIKILGEYVPSIDQWENFTKYCGSKFHELRALTSGLVGFRPSQDAIIHIHGVFDSLNGPDVIKYRDTNTLKFNPYTELFMVPIGTTHLVDQYKNYRANTVIYDINNPEVEMLHSNFTTMDRNEGYKFKKRLGNLEGRMSGEDLSMIKKYRQELNSLQSIQPGDQTPREKSKMSVLKKKIGNIQEAYVTDDEVITKVIKVNKSKGTTKVVDFASSVGKPTSEN